jgi:hypothetical protein
MDPRPSPAPSIPVSDAVTTVAEELPGLYRAILDRVALLELAGARQEAARIRMAATAGYSSAWNEACRNRLLGLITRADRALAGRERSQGWLRRPSATAR